MEEKDLNKAKINNLLEGLANMNDADIEEAREILRMAGKDPDVVVATAMKRLKSIQQQARVRGKSKAISSESQLTFPVMTFSEPDRIILTHSVAEGSKFLLADQVYSTFVLKKNDGDYAPSSVDIQQVSQTLSFRKITHEIFVSIDFTSKRPQVRFSFFKDQSVIIPQQDVAMIIKVGYLIIEPVWYPIDRENLSIINDIFNLTADDGTIGQKEALNLYFNRQKFPMISFVPPVLSLEALSSGDNEGQPGHLFTRELYPYQKDGFRWLQHCALTGTGGILGDDMGLGKTAQAISMIAWGIEHNIFKKFLIVVPGTLLENWRREFEFFAPALSPYIHHGSGRTGSVTMLASKDIVLTSYSMVVNDQYLLNKVEWDVIFADEASLMKNPDSERRIALKAIPSKIKIVMTGTPVENSLMDLWSLVDLTNEGYLGTRSEFSKRYIKKDIVTTLTEGNLDTLRNDVSLVMLRRIKTQVLDSLPERIDIHQALTMNNAEAELYETQRNLVLSNATSGAVILGLIQEMRKYTTHPLLALDTLPAAVDMMTLSKASVKFSRTVELLNEIRANREKVLIFTEYLDMIDIFAHVFEQSYNIPVFTVDGRVPVDERQHNIDLFTAAKGFSIMILNPRTAGMGLNITAANHVIHYTRQWNPALEEQATARAYRNGQIRGVNVYYLFYTNTIEEVIDDRLRAKSQLSNEVISTTTEDMTMDEYLNALKLSPLNK